MGKTVATLALLMALPTGLAAGEFYVGAGLGESVAGGRFSEPLERLGVKARDDARKVFAGAALSDHLALEATYYDFGSRTCCPQLADAGFETELDGFAATLVGRLPTERFEVFAKAGVLFWNEEGIEISFAGPRPLSADGNDVALAVGALWHVVGDFSLGAEWEAFEVAGDSIDGLWLSARIGF